MMSSLRLGGWFLSSKVYLKLKVADSLWYFSRRDGSKERQVSLLFVGWYDLGGGAKLFTVTFLWVCIQLGVNSMRIGAEE